MSTLQVHPAGEDSRRSSNVEAPTVKKGHFTYKAKIRTVEMILAKFVVYSKNYWADFKLLYKNEHILFSCWTCHPNHPFSRGDRFQVLVLSLTLAFAFSSLLEGAGSDSLIPLTILTILVQQFYDAFAKAITGCLCVQSCPDGIVKCCEGLGKLALCIQAIFAGIMLIVALVILSNLGRSPTYAITVFLCQKIGSFVVITSVVVWWGFHSKRKRQMKPTREKLAEAFVKTKWESPIGSNFCIMCMTCCIMGRTKKPPCTKWNKFWGPDKAQEDLPLLPPNYGWSVKYGCDLGGGCHRRVLYRHTGDYDPSKDLLDADGDGIVDALQGDAATPAAASGALGSATMSITVPAGVSAGQALTVQTPHGTSLIVTVPPGLAAGSSMQVQYQPPPTVVQQQPIVEMKVAGNMEAQQLTPPMQMAQPQMQMAQPQMMQPPMQMAQPQLVQPQMAQPPMQMAQPQMQTQMAPQMAQQPMQMQMAPQMAQPPMQMAQPQTMTVAIPHGVSAGQALTVQTPHGTSMTIVIPPGLAAGSSMQVQY